MDQKNQNLTPELKQIYDRVMNTQVKQPPAPPATAAAPASSSNGQPSTPPAAPTTAPQVTTQSSSLPTNQPSGTLPSVPPRPLTDDKKPFVFNGKVTPEQGNEEQAGTHAAGGKKISGSVILLGVTVLIVVWGLLWAKIFGLF